MIIVEYMDWFVIKILWEIWIIWYYDGGYMLDESAYHQMIVKYLKMIFYYNDCKIYDLNKWL